MDINFELLDAAIEDAETQANGYQHRQFDWVQVVNPYATDEHECGTAMCLAGFAAVRAGAEVPKPMPSVSYHGAWTMPFWEVDPETGKLAHGHGVHVSDFAQERLGLTVEQADALFSASNTIHDIKAMRDYLKEHPDADYNQLYDVKAMRDYLTEHPDADQWDLVDAASACCAVCDDDTTPYALA